MQTMRFKQELFFTQISKNEKNICKKIFKWINQYFPGDII